MILGIDISTSITGFCVFDELGNPVAISHVNLTKAGSFYDKVKEVKKHLMKLMYQHGFKKVVVEESMQAFASGASSAKTLFTLAKFNGIVQWLCFDQFGIEAEALNVSTARKHAGIKIDRKSKKNTKEQVLEQVMAEPILEVLFKHVEEDIDNSKKKRKPSTPGPVHGEELTKKVPENEGKKTPVIKVKTE